MKIKIIFGIILALILFAASAYIGYTYIEGDFIFRGDSDINKIEAQQTQTSVLSNESTTPKSSLMPFVDVFLLENENRIIDQGSQIQNIATKKISRPR